MTAYDDALDVDSPVSHWKLGEPSGLTLNDRKAVNAGVYSSGHPPTLGVTGLAPNNASDTAVAFDGLLQFAQVSDGASLRPASFSLESWVTIPASPSGDFKGLIFKTSGDSWNDGYGFTFRNQAGVLSIEWWVNVFTNAVVIPCVAGETLFIGGSFTGGTARAFKNGVEVGTPKTAITLTHSTNVMYLGCGATTSGNPLYYCAATLDEPAFYNTALSAGQFANHYAGTVGAGAPFLPRRPGPNVSRGPVRGPRGLVEIRYPEEGAVTALADTDSGTGSETSDVQATVPGSDTSSGTDTGTVSATVPGSDSGTGTDVQTSLVVPTAGSDSASGSDAGTVSATVPGSESSTGTDTGTASVTASSSDSSTGTDTGTASATVPGADTATGTESHTVGETGAGGEGGAGFELDVVSVTASGSDSGTGTDSGVVVDLGATPIVGDDTGTGTEDGSIVVTGVVTPPAPEPESGGGGIIDESAIYGEFRALSSHDGGMALDLGVVERSEPQRRLTRVKLPRRTPAPTAPEPAPAPVFRALGDVDGAVAHDEAATMAMVGAVDSARGREETADYQVIYDEGEADDLEILRLMGVL